MAPSVGEVAVQILPWAFLSDPVSSGLHLSMALVAAVGTPALLRRRVALQRPVLPHAVFGLSVVTLFAVSGIYHLLDGHSAARAWMQRVDHAAIFLLIAGSFTPVVMDYFTGIWRWCLLGTVWAAALSGMVAKLLYFEQISTAVGLSWYLALGWLGVAGGFQIARRHGWQAFLPLLWGGLAYSAGAIMEFAEWPVLIEGVVGPHEVFHALVVLGTALHWWFIHHTWMSAD